MQNKPDYKTAYFDLIEDLRKNEPETFARCRRRIIEKFDAENQGIFADLNKLWENADWKENSNTAEATRKPLKGTTTKEDVKAAYQKWLEAKKNNPDQPK
jgi:hypothetical protein